MASYLLNPNGVLPLDKERQLGVALSRLLELAFADCPDTTRRRMQLGAQLSAHPTVEGLSRMIFDELMPPSGGE
jgi:hypothetical protein